MQGDECLACAVVHGAARRHRDVPLLGEQHVSHKCICRVCSAADC